MTEKDLGAARRVAVTGIGMRTPAGNTVKQAAATLLAAESTATTLPELVDGDAVVTFGCAVSELDEHEHLTPKERRQLDRPSRLALCAALDAVRDAGPEWTIEPDRGGVFVGTGIGGLSTMEDAALRNQHRPNRIPAMTVVRVMNSSPAGRIGAKLGLRGASPTISTACASGATAIGEAARRIRSGDLDVAVAGGVDAPLSPLVVSAFAAMRALSTRVDAPRLASRPFDDDRDGFVMAEGAVFLVLERLDRARERGAHIFGEVAGYHANTDPGDIVAPAPDGAIAAACVQAALHDAGLSAADITHVSAHGTSTTQGDRAEALALARAFGDRCPPVTAPKGVVGHMVGAAGAFEAAMALVFAADGVVPPVANFRSGRDAEPIDLVVGAPRRVAPGPAVSTSFGFGGQNASLVLTPAPAIP
ncbi:3-oxoacyl-[acyl-carrier-protein] synthase II [Actinokineospora alba]|uniref:3-oxoacyl-[acyl-carrier-protein] synthase II n=1 Tax=Actinokineospora alba TaxID=504798 RepID=A0A1H0HFP8_9PSEU|nr:beta-ketoacyl-[acyl-carrier-protein] synthase family protein [Actinokineospora alba]TDP64901.1 3-oxoacyl-[acyl-carrier-protein] synthase II [Actinokineospora alba]SDH48790.1 3-oxoacyl-[acyl-carrier-protein] synthase II [Actinokineospora alba]SDO18039.1 3-oxoacyl-[acyl-carrier-protein] synthase II [Actinokineospora alba]